MASTDPALALISRLKQVSLEPPGPLDGAAPRSYLLTYHAFLSFIRSRERLDVEAVLLGASLVYSWMPTILRINPEGLNRTADILENVRQGAEPSASDLEQVKLTINNSMVGASKLLHFIDPARFPIWDSRVCAYLGWRANQVAEVSRYREYRALCLEVAAHEAFAPLHAALNARHGPLGTLRAAELLMYLGGLAAVGSNPTGRGRASH